MSVQSFAIEADNADFTCRIDGEISLETVNAEWLLTGFNLLPGANMITTSALIKLIYRPRWYANSTKTSQWAIIREVLSVLFTLTLPAEVVLYCQYCTRQFAVSGVVTP